MSQKKIMDLLCNYEIIFLPMLWPCAKTAYHNVLKYLSKHSFDLLIYQQVVKILLFVYRSNSQDTSIYIEY